MNGFITAIRTLTIIPVPGKESGNLAGSLFFFPVVGAIVGALVVLTAMAAIHLLQWPFGAGVACIAVATVLTGGLHLDGLADTFDSFGGHTREKKLEIMKDPRVGSFGVMAIVLVMFFKCAAIARFSSLAMSAEMWALVIPYTLSRAMLAGLVVWLPYARPEGGTGQPFVACARPAHFVVGVILACAICCAACAGFMGLMWLVMGAGWLLLAGAIMAVLMVWMWHVYGGVTGDLLGMASEMIETILLVSLAVVV